MSSLGVIPTERAWRFEFTGLTRRGALDATAEALCLLNTGDA
jgi:hypothetical protein